MPPMGDVHVEIRREQIRKVLRIVLIDIKTQKAWVVVEESFDLGMVHIVHMCPTPFHLIGRLAIGLAASLKVPTAGMIGTGCDPVIAIACVQQEKGVRVSRVQLSKEPGAVQHETRIDKGDIGEGPDCPEPIQWPAAHGNVCNHSKGKVFSLIIFPMHRRDPTVLKQLVKRGRRTSVQADQDYLGIALPGLELLDCH